MKISSHILRNMFKYVSLSLSLSLSFSLCLSDVFIHDVIVSKVD